MRYDKPHLSFADQLARLESRGMTCADRDLAIATLRRLGYYRLSAYAYPFRRPLDANARAESSVQRRSDDFESGTDFETIAVLADFDRRLRLAALDALEAFELALRVQIAYVLGARSTFGHVNPVALDPAALDQPSERPDSTAYQSWRDRYESTVASASEDFVTHYREKYDGELPIWVAIELLEFGSLTRLLGFMTPADQTAVARELGFTQGKLLVRTAKVLNYARNVAAHHGRFWNRSLTYQLPRYPLGLPSLLDHLREQDPVRRRKIYGVLAVTAYLARIIDPDTAFPATVAELLAEFPRTPRVSPYTDMGFPDDWKALQVWRT